MLEDDPSWLMGSLLMGSLGKASLICEGGEVCFLAGPYV